MGALPVTAGVVPTNTRAIVGVTFNEAGVVKAIEVARYFEEPYVNDYWYLVKASAKDPLEGVAAFAVPAIELKIKIRPKIALASEIFF